jgi:hypothetical protein
LRILSALALLLLGAPAAADTAGSGLGAFSLSASAPAVQFRVAEPSTCFSSAAATNGCEGVMPEAVSTLRSGPLGHGLAAVVWPGVIASGAGSLLITAGGSGVPPQATTLNDPVKAEAYNNTGSHTVTYDQVPGSMMSATAYDDRVSATGSVLQSLVLPIGSFGRTTGTSDVHLVGADKGVAVAHSEVQDVTVAGVVRIASVVSDATATTDGRHATARGGTRVSGISVAGVPVTIDSGGVTVAGQRVPVKNAQQTVNSALAGLGMSIAVSPAQGTPMGAQVTYTASSLVLVWASPGGATETLVLGGANVSVAAGTALRFPGGILPTTLPGAAGPGGSGVGPVSSAAGGQQSPGGPVGPGIAAPQGSPGHLLLPLGLDVPLPALPWLAGILGALATVAVAAGLKRLPDRVLEETPGDSC